MNVDDLLCDEDDAGAELVALSETRRAARDRWFRRFAANERRHRSADAWARLTEASRAPQHRGATPPSRSP